MFFVCVLKVSVWFCLCMHLNGPNVTHTGPYKCIHSTLTFSHLAKAQPHNYIYFIGILCDRPTKNCTQLCPSGKETWFSNEFLQKSGSAIDT